jgi:hypothetical protein
MDQETKEDVLAEIEILTKSGFYHKGEILEIIDDLFYGEDVDFDFVKSELNIAIEKQEAEEKNWEEETDFDRLESAFDEITENKIIAIHNCGYTLTDGIQDSFEVYYQLENKNIVAEGFCFYHFQDIEGAIEFNKLLIGFGDFKDNEEKSLEIGQKVAEILKKHNFEIKWEEDINKRIEITLIEWKKRLSDKEYEMEGGLNSYLKVHEHG